MVDRGVDRSSFRTQDGEVSSHAASGSVDHGRFGDAAIDALKAVFLDRDHVAICQRGTALGIFTSCSVHDTAAGNELEVEEKTEESVVPVLLVLLDRRQGARDAVPHVHRSLFVRCKVFRTKDVGGQVVVTVVVTAVECDVHDSLVQHAGSCPHRAIHFCIDGGWICILVGHVALPSNCPDTLITKQKQKSPTSTECAARQDTRPWSQKNARKTNFSGPLLPHDMWYGCT